MTEPLKLSRAVGIEPTFAMQSLSPDGLALFLVGPLGIEPKPHRLKGECAESRYTIDPL